MKTFAIFLGFAILLSGCRSNSNDTAGEAEKAVDMSDTVRASGNSKVDNENKIQGNSSLKLNNGAKWKANAETTEEIKKMLSLVKEYLDKKKTDHVTLSENLDKEFNSLIQKCTMSGPAHDQLHEFLLPLKEKITKLKSTDDIEAVKDIQTYLDSFFNYFQ